MRLVSLFTSTFIFSSIQVLLVSAGRPRYAGIAIYGVERANNEGLTTETDFIKIQSPMRDSLDHRSDVASATISINDDDRIVTSYKNGALVTVLRANELLCLHTLRNSDRRIRKEKTKKTKFIHAKPGDVVIVFVPHTTRLEITEAAFYEAFNGQDQSRYLDLVQEFVQKFTSSEENSVDNRFTILAAKITDRSVAGYTTAYTIIQRQVSSYYPHPYSNGPSFTPFVSYGAQPNQPTPSLSRPPGYVVPNVLDSQPRFIPNSSRNLPAGVSLGTTSFSVSRQDSSHTAIISDGTNVLTPRGSRVAQQNASRQPLFHPASSFSARPSASSSANVHQSFVYPQDTQPQSRESIVPRVNPSSSNDGFVNGPQFH